MDRRRLAEVRAGTAGQQHSAASGYVVGQRMVLTCRHVVDDNNGRRWPRLEIWLGHPSDGLRRRVTATVTWVHPERDAALLRIVDEPFADRSLVRWGCFAGSAPVPYTGLGYPRFADYESGQGVEQLSGLLPPLGVGVEGGFVLDQGAAPEAAVGRLWQGVSGAAVFCHGLLTAVVTRDDREFGNRRLHAIPASALTADPEFARLITEDAGTAPVLEPVELAEFLQPPVSPTLACTPGSLLAAGVGAVEFTGRKTELAELAAWRDRAEGFAMMLVVGEGGQGKTRLARQFAVQSRQNGWAVGVLAAGTSASAGDDSQQQPQVIMELARRMRDAALPVLLVIDYAETRPEEIAILADILASNPSTQPMRMLLLSRSAGAWWAGLTDALEPQVTHRITLNPLSMAGQERHEAYAAAVTDLARHLATLPEPPTEQTPGQKWSLLAEQLVTQLVTRSPGLDHPLLGNALTLQITALTDLLAAATGEELLGRSPEQELVRHERSYLRRAAAKRNLFKLGILSERSDDDDRKVDAWEALERALAGIILLGPCAADRAQAIGALASEARAVDVMNWLGALYPPPDKGFVLGVVQPDRLAELLLGPILIQQATLLKAIGALTETFYDGYSVLVTLTRTSAYLNFGQVGEQTAELIVNRPNPFAVAAPVLAATPLQTTPLEGGLFRLGQQDPRAFRQTAYEVLDQLPETSVSAATFSAALASKITSILRSLADADPDTYLPDLARTLNDLGIRLGEAGQRQAALATTQEAVSIRRQLAWFCS